MDVQDYGDVLYDTNNINDVINMSHLGCIASCTSRLSEQVRQVLRDGRKVLTIGGDHSLSIGTIDGHVKVFNSKYVYIQKKINKTIKFGYLHTCHRKNRMWE